MRSIIRYILRFVELWLFWFWAPALDVLAFLSDPYIPHFTFSRETYLIIPIIGFVATNIKMFTDHEKQIRQLEMSEADIQVTIGINGLHVPSKIPTTFALVQRQGGNILQEVDDFNGDGIPDVVVLSSELNATNIGREEGTLVWRIDASKSKLPSYLSIKGSLTSIDDPFHFLWRGVFEGTTSKIPARTRQTGMYHLALEVTEKDPIAFAHSLIKTPYYQIAIQYCTDRLVDSSLYRTAIIQGDTRSLFHFEILPYWEKHGHDNLKQTVLNCYSTNR